jgi:4-hydroxy-3-polyprenylbenzoate decarboxylase
MEGPFGEWPGYYAHGAAKEPVIRVKRVYYRNDPILCGAPPLKPPFVTFGVPIGAAAIWNYLEKADVPDIKGVWCAIGSSAAAAGYAMRSTGRDGQLQGTSYIAGPTTDYDCDIVYASGQFIVWPEGVQQK